ncbi:hypothetical protein, partial [Arthrobacter sp. NPDC056727]|uniref:hypothetical protein n=1 Tax=Arthrobacter sp. NPDC056727 TaxID=3345927 RepID=UPI00366C74AC
MADVFHRLVLSLAPLARYACGVIQATFEACGKFLKIASACENFPGGLGANVQLWPRFGVDLGPQLYV